MKTKLKKSLSFIMVVMIVLSCVTIYSSAAATNEDQFVMLFNTSDEAQELYDNVNIISCDSDSKKQISLEEGITVICGRNLNTALIGSNDTKEYGLTEQLCKTAYTGEDAISETYMAIGIKQDDCTQIEYISVTYESDVSKEKIDEFVNAELESENVDRRIRQFIYKQVTNEESIYNDKANSVRSSEQTMRVATAIDTNYYIANYTTNTGSVFPLMIYKKNITYDAYIEAGALSDDRYYIVSRVRVTPGNDISSFDAAEIASLNASDLYNDTYSNAIAIKGVRTDFVNLNSSTDSFIALHPERSVNDVNEETISISVGLPASVSLSFDVVTNTASKINLETDFSASGTSTVKFEAVKRFLQFTNPCLSTEEFHYNAVIYMGTTRSVMTTEVGTSVLYYFQNAGPNNAIWAGSARTLTYNNG